MESSNISLVMKDILRTGKYSDFTIKCEGHQFKVHQVIVCSQSPFFDAAVCGGFQVGSTAYYKISSSNFEQEASDKIVDLPDDDFHTIRRLISYLYLQDFDQDGSGSSYQVLNETGIVDHAIREGSPMEINITETPETKAPSAAGTDEVPYNNLHVYVAADKFGIDSLKNLARDRLASWLQRNWDKEEFPQVVRSVFQSLPPHESQLPDIITHLISEKAEDLLKQESVLDLLQEFGGLAIAVLKEVVGYFQSSEAERKRLVALCVENTFGNSLTYKLNGISRCRHCQAAFNLRVERETIGFGTVRCGICRTRH